MKRICIVLLVAFSLSCDKNEDQIPVWVFEVTTAGIDMNCGLVLIAFKEADHDRIEKITGSTWRTYNAYGLDQNTFGNAGQVLTVKVRKTLDSELFACITFGPTYPWVTVLKAEPKE